MENEPLNPNTLQEIALSLSEHSLDLDITRQSADILQSILEQATNLSAAQCACIAFYDAQTKSLNAAASYQLSVHFQQNMAFLSGGLAEQVFFGDRYIVSNDHNKPHKLSELARSENIQSFVCLPLGNHQKRIGIAYIYRKNHNDFTSEDVLLLKMYFNMATGVLISNRLYHELQQQFDAYRQQRDQLQKNQEKLAKHDNMLQLYTGALADANIFAVELITDVENAKHQAEKQVQDLAIENAKLEDATQKKDRFLASVSHDLRTPLTAIIGYCELMEEEAEDSPLDYLKDLKRINNAAVHLLGLINNILDLSKIEADKIELEKIDFNLHNTVADVVDLLTEQARTKHNTISYRLVPAIPKILTGDPTRIRQILTNLIGNSIKFTSNGKIIIEVTITKELENQIQLYFEVTDTGYGIPLEEQDRIFDRFLQANRSITRTHGGSGLGLSITKGLVEIMDGNVGVRSQPDRGTTFWFTIQIDKSAKAPLDPDSHPPYINFNMLHILIVEHHQTHQTCLYKLLTSWGCECDIASDKASTLEKLKNPKRHYDIIILEKALPDGNGIALAKQIRKQHDTMPTRFILMTDFGVRGDAKEAREAAIFAYLTKPFPQSLLYECINTVMHILPNATTMPLVTRYSLTENSKQWKGHVLLLSTTTKLLQEILDLLKHLHFWVDFVTNQEEMEITLTQQHYQLVMVDCNQPELNYADLLAAIKAQDKLEPMPIIGITQKPSEHQAQLAPFDTDMIIQLPVNTPELQSILGRWLDI